MDPTRLTPRQRRNELEESFLHPHTELLVLGTFTEDTEDDGYVTTTWVHADDAPYKDFETELEEYRELLSNMATQYFDDRGSGSDEGDG